jgi:membrane protein implicated in regulation of membrane protease activity
MLLVGSILLAVFVLPDAWDVPVVVLGAVAEVAETGFWVWFSRRGDARVGPQTLIGAPAVVVQACRPTGSVRIQSEVWSARCDVGADAGDTVVVRSVEGLTLVVERTPLPDRDETS